MALPVEQTNPIPNNLPNPVAQQTAYQVVSATGAITIPGGLAMITKAGVAVLTLAAPTVDGLILTIDSHTAQAHTVTITAGLRGAGAGADVGTFGGAIGDGDTLYSYNGFWFPMPGANTNVTWA